VSLLWVVYMLLLTMQVKCPTITLDNTMLKIRSTCLVFPDIRYHGTASNEHTDFRWNLESKKFLLGATGVSWMCLREPNVPYDAAGTFGTDFEDQLVACGVVSNKSDIRKIGGNSILNFQQDVRSQLENVAKQRPDIVVLMLKGKHQGKYSTFKYLADKFFVFHSICVTESNFKPWGRQGHRTQYAANVAMKANLKKSGHNHSVTGIEATLQKTLILGADLTHAGLGAVEGCPSIAAVVGSMHENAANFRGILELQPKEEVGLRLAYS
jgi:eukaryotic translation initiation factor 2C